MIRAPSAPGGVVARCQCGWRGVPTYTGGALIRAPRYVTTTRGRIEQIPGRRLGSLPSCPRCRADLSTSEAAA